MGEVAMDRSSRPRAPGEQSTGDRLLSVEDHTWQELGEPIFNAVRRRFGLRPLCTAFLTAVAIITAGAGYARVCPTPPALTNETEPCFTDPDDAIRFAVFRYQFDHNASGQKTNAGVYCLSLSLVGQEELDPSDELVVSFTAHEPPVKKRSQCEISIGGVFDRQTSRQGLMFYIDQIKRTSETEAVVTGGYYEGGLSGSGNSYHVVRRGDEWIVTGDQMLFIS
jgi:hypothetical protein